MRKHVINGLTLSALISSPSSSSGSKSLGSGKQTLRFRSNGTAEVEEVSSTKAAAEDKINQLLENFLGIHDAELGEHKISYFVVKWISDDKNRILFPASRIFEVGQSKTNTMEFAEAIDDSDIAEFGFDDAFIFELWGAITDAKSGR